MAKVRTPRARRVMRHQRVRNRASGRPERPRLSVFRSLQHIYAQVIDDTQGHTLAAASSVELRSNGGSAGDGTGTKQEVAQRVGRLVAQRAREKGVEQVVFDRGGFKYHGRVQALADAAREGGLDF